MKDQQEDSIALDLAGPHPADPGEDSQGPGPSDRPGMTLGIDEIPRGVGPEAIAAPVGAGWPGGFHIEGGCEEIEGFAGVVVGGEVQLPDVEGLALVGLELLIFFGGVLFLQDVAGGGVPGEDAGTSLQLDAFAIVEDFGLCRGDRDPHPKRDRKSRAEVSEYFVV